MLSALRARAPSTLNPSAGGPSSIGEARSHPRAASATASKILVYPVQRHRFPLKASRIWPAVGTGVRSRRALAERIIPGWQKPHWSAPQTSKARCTGCGPSADARPSMVVTSRPAEACASVMHESVGFPSTRTVQAPQSPLSQPCLVPVSRSS